MPIQATFLRDTDNGGSATQPRTISERLAAFIAAARSSLHIAIYDFRLSDGLGAPIVRTLVDQASAGLEVQIAFDAGKPSDNNNGAMFFALMGADPAPPGTGDFLKNAFANSDVQIKPIHGTTLMHNKYIVRDVNTAAAAVWTDPQTLPTMRGPSKRTM